MQTNRSTCALYAAERALLSPSAPFCTWDAGGGAALLHLASRSHLVAPRRTTARPLPNRPAARKLRRRVVPRLLWPDERGLRVSNLPGPALGGGETIAFVHTAGSLDDALLREVPGARRKIKADKCNVITALVLCYGALVIRCIWSQWKFKTDNDTWVRLASYRYNGALYKLFKYIGATSGCTWSRMYLTHV